jgi:WD40 repeat protein
MGPRDEKVVRVFDLGTGAEQAFGPLPGVGEGATGGIQGLAFVDRDRLLASVTGAGLASIDLATGEIRALARQPSGSFRLSLEGRLGLGVNESGTGVASDPLVRFSLDGTAPTPLTFYPSATAVAVDTSGTRVATGSSDGTIRIGLVAGGEPHVFFGHEGAVVALAFSPDGHWLASTVNDRTIWLWPVPDVTRPPPHKRPYQELLAALRTHTNLRAVPDRASATGYTLEPGPFPGWAHPPAW